MGIDKKRGRGPPLPAPTDDSSSTGVGAGADVNGTDLSRVTDRTDRTDRSDGTSYSLPEDGSPVTIPTHRRSKDGGISISQEGHQSQTSLLIEYFEGGKGSEVSTRRPSVRVKVTPSSRNSKSRGRSNNGHIQITKSRSGNEEAKGGRKPTYSKRINLSSPNNRSDRLVELDGDGHSLSSYASATEESNVSRNPIEIEVGPRRHRSPLIPDPTSSVREQQLGSDVSSMLPNSFLDDDSGVRSDRERSRGFSKGEALIAGASAGLGAAAIADNVKAPTRRRSRSLSRERIITQKAAEKVRSAKSEQRQKRSSRSRSVSENVNHSEKHTTDVLSSPRRRSRGGYQDDSVISAADSSLLTASRVSDQRSYRSGASSKSITNPKLLETVEDAIRRLILPELNALKKENASRDKEHREHRTRRSSLSSTSGLSQESRDPSRSKRSSLGEASAKSKGNVDERDRSINTAAVKPANDRRRDRDRGGSESPRTPRTSRTPRGYDRALSEEPDTRRSDKRATFGALAAGIGLGTLASALKGNDNNDSKEFLDEKEKADRRRRRARSRSRSDSVAESYESHHDEVPPMPMMSDINASEITRSSILSASTERPRSASGEKSMTPVKEVSRGFISPSVTPTRSPYASNRSLGMHHSNGSTPNLSRTNLQHHDEYELNDHGQKVPMNRDIDEAAYEQEYHDGERDGGHGKAIAAGLAGAAAGALAANAMHHHDDPDMDDDEEDIYYQDSQHVPSPLKYVPYNQEKRGLSPIQSVSGYTEADEQERQQKQRDYRGAQSTTSKASHSTLNQSPRRKTSASLRSELSDPRNSDVGQSALTESELTNDPDREYWEEQRLVNDRNRDIDHENYIGSDPFLDKHRQSGYTDDGEWQENDVDAAGQQSRSLGANPGYVHTPAAVESAVASLVDASVLTGMTGDSRSHVLDQRDSYDSRLSEETGRSRGGVNRQTSYASYDEDSERNFTARGHSPHKSDDGHQHGSEPILDREISPYPEYELDDQGRKITMPNYKQTSKADAAMAGMAGTAAGAAAALIVNRHTVPDASESQYAQQEQIPGAPLQKSFKDRAMDYAPPSPRQSVENYMDDDEADHESVRMTANALPNANDPMPEFADDASVTTNRSALNRPDSKYNGEQNWEERYYKTPSPRMNRKEVGSGSARSEHGDGLMDGLALGAGAVAGGAAAHAATSQHNRDLSLEDGDYEWAKTSEERKRDTLVTNPYEGSSPISLLGGEKDRNLLSQLGYEDVKQNVGGAGYSTGSPGAIPKDEGYISSAPNARSAGGATPETKPRGVGFTDPTGMGPGEFDNDPFYTPHHQQYLSSMSQGMESPLYDNAMGTSRDSIQSKDIVALMDHLTVRDAQRNARDTEILVTLVRSAAEMRNSFEDMKRLLADTEDVVITEVQRNTDRSVQKVINGPRPLPQSVKSLRSGTGDDDDIPSKRRNVFKRALKGLSMRSNNDLAQIERMLVQLLGDVEGLKVAQGLAADYDDMEPEGAAEQDGGYEPEGHAGTNTTDSHASQSGHFSNPLSRGTSASQGFGGRKFSENRISTVPEGDEDELDLREQEILDNAYDNADHLSPVRDNGRPGSVPLGTPPQRVEPQSLSNENSPKADKGKKHKSTSSFGWNPIPKISRWSETTASTVARGFRSSGRKDTEPFSQHTSSHPPSRSGSDMGHFDHDPYGGDKLHSGFSQEHLPRQPSPGGYAHTRALSDESNLPVLLPPDDPKYKAHRNSLNLQHPQPRPGQQYQSALERGAQAYGGGAASPKSMDWSSQVSLNRLPQNANLNRYSAGTTGTDGSTFDADYASHDAPGGLAPARPPKEALDTTMMSGGLPYVAAATKPAKPSPLAIEQRSDQCAPPQPQDRRVSAASAADAGAYEGGPRAPHRSSVPARKPTGPRSMGSPRAPVASAGGDGLTAQLDGMRGKSASPAAGNQYQYW